MPIDFSYDINGGSAFAPIISGVPTISGTEEQGATLTATPASVSADPASVTTWQWQNNNVDIAGATSSTYVLQATDVGDTVTVIQTETNSEGFDTAESAATGTIAASGGGSNPSPLTLSITADRTTGTAPMGVNFDTSATSPDAGVVIEYHDILRHWDFDDAGNYARIDSDIDWGQSKNFASGPITNHTFDTGGSYTVTATAYDGVNTPQTDTITITVVDPFVEYATADIAVISDSDFIGKPAGAAEYSTYAAARAALSGRSKQMFLFRRGRTFSNGDMQFNDNSADKVYFGAFGAGADPIIQETSYGGSGIRVNPSPSATREVTITGLDMRGPYDPGSPPSGTTVHGQGEGILLGTSGSALNGFATIHNCSIDGFVKSIWAGRGPGVGSIVVSDTAISGWHDYGFFGTGYANIGFSGFSAKQPWDTINGQGFQNSANANGGNVRYADQGPVRISDQYGPVSFALADFRNFTDWSNTIGSRAFQPAIRVNSGQADQKVSLDRVYSIGGRNTTHVDTGSSSTGEALYTLIDKYKAINIDHGRSFAYANRGGTTWRNAVFVCPNIPPGISNGLQAAILSEVPNNNQPGNLDRRVEVYSCNFNDLRNDANSIKRGGADRDYNLGNLNAFSNRYIGNNVEYVPNNPDTPITPGVLLNTTGIRTVSYAGERWETQGLDTTRAVGTSASATFRQQASIPADSGKIAIDDFYGNIRSGVRQKGAYQVE